MIRIIKKHYLVSFVLLVSAVLYYINIALILKLLYPALYLLALLGYFFYIVAYSLVLFFPFLVIGIVFTVFSLLSPEQEIKDFYNKN
jgi:hypothetical protein